MVCVCVSLIVLLLCAGSRLISKNVQDVVCACVYHSTCAAEAADECAYVLCCVYVCSMRGLVSVLCVSLCCVYHLLEVTHNYDGIHVSAATLRYGGTLPPCIALLIGRL